MHRKNGENNQIEPCNTGSSVDSSIYGTCHMATETTTHSLCDCVALAEFIFVAWLNIFMKPNDYEKIP
jgi:hypothetical protein